MTDNSNLLFESLEDQENSTTFLATSANLKNKISEGEITKIGTPRAKNVLSNRKVLAEKTPNNSNIKRPFISPTKSSSSPSLLNNSTPLAQHPSLKEIAATTKTLTNPPDLFLQPLQKRRSIRKSVENKAKDEIANTTSKLVAVFPTTSDELDFEEIEHAASSLVDDGDSLNFLSGTSKIIPNLELHENLDFSNLISCASKSVVETVIHDNEEESVIVIEPIIVEFKLEEEEEEQK